MPARISPLRVLVVDDYPESADMLAQVLELASSGGLTTETATNGAEAVQLAMARRPDVIVSDIDMPVMNGIDAAKAIRHNLRSPAPLLIGLTGNLHHAVTMATHQVFDHVMTKPPDIERLLSLILSARPD